MTRIPTTHEAYAAFMAECIKADIEMDSAAHVRNRPKKEKQPKPIVKAKTSEEQRIANSKSRHDYYLRCKKDPSKLAQHREQSRRWAADHPEYAKKYQSDHPEMIKQIQKKANKNRSQTAI